MRIALLTTDLMFSSRARVTAESSGCQLDVVSRLEELVSMARAGDVVAVFLDLSYPNLQLAELVPSLRSAHTQPIHLVAFGPHVHEGKLDVARQAGCDRVLTKGQFSNQLDQLFVELCRRPFESPCDDRPSP